MGVFFLGLRLPETLPGLDQPLPVNEAAPGMRSKRSAIVPTAMRVRAEASPMKIRGSARLVYEARRHEEWWW